MKYFDAAYPHYHVTGVYLDGQFIPNAVAADSEAGWVDVTVLNDGYVMKDYTGRPQTVRHYGNVTITSHERDQLNLIMQAIAV